MTLLQELTYKVKILSGAIVRYCPCLQLCVIMSIHLSCVCVNHLLVHDNSGPVEARITKF